MAFGIEKCLMKEVEGARWRKGEKSGKWLTITE